MAADLTALSRLLSSGRGVSVPFRPRPEAGLTMDGSTPDSGPVSPMNSASVLRNAQNLSGFDPVQLAGLRAQRAGELSDRIANDLGTVDAPNLGRDRYLLQDLNADSAEDPYTGTAERTRIAGIRKNLDDASMMERPEMAQAAKTSADRNAFAKWLESQSTEGGKLAAQNTGPGKEALDAEARRKMAIAGRGGLGTVAEGIPGDPLGGLSPQAAAIVKGLTDYTIPLPTGMALRTPEWQDYLGRAKLVDPSFDVSQYAARQGMRNDKAFQTNIQKLATAQQHLGALEEKARGLDNFGGLLSPLNTPINRVKEFFSRPSVQGYDVDQLAVATELGAALKGTGVVSEHEIQDWQERLSRNQSPESFKETFAAAKDLIQKRLHEGRIRYDTVMGKPGAYDVAMQNYETRGLGGGDVPAAGGAQPSASAAAYAEYQRRQSVGGR